MSGHCQVFSGLPVSLTGRVILDFEAFKNRNKNVNKQQEACWLLKKHGTMSLRSPETNKFMSFSALLFCVQLVSLNVPRAV